MAITTSTTTFCCCCCCWCSWWCWCCLASLIKCVLLLTGCCDCVSVCVWASFEGSFWHVLCVCACVCVPVFDSCSIASQPTQPAACINSTFHCLFAHSLSSISSSIRTIRQWAIGNCHSLKGNYQTSATVKAAAAAAVDVVIFFHENGQISLNCARFVFLCT